MSEFRKAVEVVSPSEVKTVRAEPIEDGEKVDNPIADSGRSVVVAKENDLLATYEQEHNRPLVAEYFGADSIWDKEPSLKRDLQEIEAYLRNKVESNKLDNSVRAGQKFLKELEREAGLTTYESTSTRIAKLLAFIDFKKVVEE